MASSGQYRRGGEDNECADEQTGARFFKIILLSTVRDKKLLLPRKFIRDSAGALLSSKSATLRVPSGDEWEVELIKEGEDVWFGNSGWQRFAEFYSLEYGHFLVFQYSGRSQFSAVIFGRSATEIDYPVREVIRIEDAGNTRGKSPLAGNVAHDDDEAGQGNNGKEKRQKSCWKHSGDQFESRGGFSKTKEEEKQASSSRKRRAVTVDGFTLKLTKGYFVTGPYIPLWFTEKHIEETEQWVILESGGKDWILGLVKIRSKYTKFSSGWSSFKEDNSLKKGDFCTFELIRGRHGSTVSKLKVTFARI